MGELKETVVNMSPAEIHYKTTHWTQLLDEGKRIFKDEVQDLEMINKRITKLISELDEEIKQLHHEEDSLFFKVKKQYTDEEIKIAKQEFEQQTI